MILVRFEHTRTIASEGGGVRGPQLVVVVSEFWLRHLNHHLTSFGPWVRRCAQCDPEIYRRSSSMILVRFEHTRTIASDGDGV